MKLNKLIGIAMILLAVGLVTVPQAEANVITDFWEWFTGLFKGDEVSKYLPTEDPNGNKITYYPNALMVERTDGTIILEIGGKHDYTIEDDKPIHIENAKSLKGSHIQPYYLENDGITDFEIDDYNLTSLTFEPIIKNSKDLNRNIPYKVNGIAKGVFKYNSLDERTKYTIRTPNILADNFSAGDTSTTISFRSNDSDSRDTWIQGNDAGAGACGFLRADIGKAGGGELNNMMVGQFFNSSINPTTRYAINATLVLSWLEGTNGDSQNISMFLLNNDSQGGWEDNNDALAACNAQCPSYNNWDCDNAWAGGAGGLASASANTTASASVIVTGFSVNHSTIPFSGADLTSDVNLILNGMHNLTWIISCVDCDAGDLFGLAQKEATDTNIDPLWILELGVINNVPNNPTNVLMNSTVIDENYDQLNYSNESISANFYCDDDDTSDTLEYQLDLFKNGVNVTAMRTVNSCSDPEYIGYEFNTANTTATDVINFEVRVCDDSGDCSGLVASNNVTIMNVPPWQKDVEGFRNATWTEDYGTYDAIEVGDVNLNFSDIEDDFTPTPTLLSESDTSAVDCSISSGALECVTQANQSGSNIVVLNLSDSGGQSIEMSTIVTISAVNDAPNTPEILNINTTDGSNLTAYDVNAFFTIGADAETDPLNYTIEWFRNGVKLFEFGNRSAVSTDIQTQEILNSTNTTAGSNISYSLVVCDYELCGATVHSPNITIINAAPESSVVLLNSTQIDQANYSNETLGFNFFCSDGDGGSLTWAATVYENGIGNYGLDGTCSNSTYNNIAITSANTTARETWSVSVNFTDGIEDSTTNFSNNITIRSVSPTQPSIDYPPDELITPNSSIQLNCGGSVDEEGDLITYEFFWNTTDPPTPENAYTTNTTAGNITASPLVDQTRYYWRCRASDNESYSSYSAVRAFTSEQYWHNQTQVEYETPVTEGQSIDFALNVSFNPYQLSSIGGTLDYNGTNYTADSTTNTSRWFRFEFDGISASSIGGDDNVSFFFDLSLVYPNSTSILNRTDTYSHEVNNTGVLACDGVSNTTQALAYNITFWDESNNTQINYIQNVSGVTIAANFIMWTDNPAVNNTELVDLVNQSEVDICIIPPDVIFNVDVIIEYELENYGKRWFYVDEGTVSNVTQELHLYLLDSNLDDEITLNVIDSDGSPKVGVLVNAQKYYTGLDAYTTIAMARTDDDGIDNIYLNKFDTIYRFVVTEEGTIIYTSFPEKIAIDSLVLPISPDTMADLVNEFEGVSYTMTFDNVTKNVVVTYSNADVKNFCLLVRRMGSTSNEVTYENCNLTASSGTLMAKVNGTGTYQAVFYGYGSPRDVINIIEIINGAIQEIAEVIGLDGIAYTTLLAGTLAGMGLAIGSAPLALLGTFLGVGFMAIVGFIKLSYGILITLGIIIIIVLSRLKEKF